MPYLDAPAPFLPSSLISAAAEQGTHRTLPQVISDIARKEERFGEARLFEAQLKLRNRVLQQALFPD